MGGKQTSWREGKHTEPGSGDAAGSFLDIALVPSHSTPLRSRCTFLTARVTLTEKRLVSTCHHLKPLITPQPISPSFHKHSPSSPWHIPEPVTNPNRLGSGEHTSPSSSMCPVSTLSMRHPGCTDGSSLGPLCSAIIGVTQALPTPCNDGVTMSSPTPA